VKTVLDECHPRLSLVSGQCTVGGPSRIEYASTQTADGTYPDSPQCSGLGVPLRPRAVHRTAVAERGAGSCTL
jgi:hypothetical protein